MKAIATAIHDVYIIEPTVFGDNRGFFLESWNQKQFNEAIGQDITFVQDNHSRSSKGVLRGLHYQLQQAQGKLVRAVSGSIIDVAVDLRKSSPTFGRHVSELLTSESFRQLWVPAGCAHGFVVLSESADVLYKATDYYSPEYESCIKYDDPDLAIEWGLNGISPILSSKDQQGVPFKVAEHYL